MSADMRVMAEERFVHYYQALQLDLRRREKSGELTQEAYKQEHWEMVDVFRQYIEGRVWLARNRYLPMPLA
jgi:hypothetical protein